MFRSLLRPTTSLALASGRRSLSTSPLSSPGSLLFPFNFFLVLFLISQIAQQSRLALLAGGALVGTGAYLLTSDTLQAESHTNWEDVKADIADMLDNGDYDDGSYGPLFVRLAWHASGTYDVASKTGGSNGATMRYAPESSDGANAGLDIARNLLEPLKKVFFFFFFFLLFFSLLLLTHTTPNRNTPLSPTLTSGP